MVTGGGGGGDAMVSPPVDVPPPLPPVDVPPPPRPPPLGGITTGGTAGGIATTPTPPIPARVLPVAASLLIANESLVAGTITIPTTRILSTIIDTKMGNFVSIILICMISASINPLQDITNRSLRYLV
jgi:hypothetical protein